ncbi:MAG TPA: hypothetical protein VM490_18270, partial [Armatimonadaceae bacterium]|nr:hypothetical protein [Armatimonadaceae bacterium]
MGTRFSKDAKLRRRDFLRTVGGGTALLGIGGALGFGGALSGCSSGGTYAFDPTVDTGASPTPT